VVGCILPSLATPRGKFWLEPFDPVGRKEWGDVKEKETVIRALAAPALAMLTVAVLGALPVSAQQTSTRPQVLSNAVVNEPIQFDTSPPLRDLLTQFPPQQGILVMHPVLRPKLDKLKQAAGQGVPAVRNALPEPPGPLISTSTTIGLNFDGIGQNAINNCPDVSGFAVAPPDTNAAVGDTQVVQWVNLCYAVFDKATGALVAGPFPGNQFWAGFRGPCKLRNDGDPIIQWDKANHVWVASQNVFEPPYRTCIAVSQTADATGSYNRYLFRQPALPDYPKWGLTPNVYYQTQNLFGRVSFLGVNVCAYDGAAMRAGRRAKQICILDNSNGTLFDDSMLPADDDATASAGITPEVLLGSIDNFLPGDTHVYEYVFTVSFRGRGSGTLAGVNGTMPIDVPAFNLALCSPGGSLTSYCVPQPDVPDLLDTLGDRLMYRLARFDDGTTQHFLVTHSINDTAAMAARWYEFRAPEGSSTLLLYQSGQTADDSEYRWMGSVAYDKFGDITLGYSRSSAAAGDYPSIYLSGQTAGEPTGTTDTESLIFQGSGSQADTDSRWGDYSSMALDGADLCSFWYTTEYYPATGSFAWNTRIAGEIKFNGCK
jgi:hypothetical protein